MEELTTTQITEAMPLEAELAPEQRFSLLDRAQNFGANIIDNVQTRAENLRASTKRAIALGGIAIAGIGFAGAELTTNASADSTAAVSAPATLSKEQCSSNAVAKPIIKNTQINHAGTGGRQEAYATVINEALQSCDTIIRVENYKFTIQDTQHRAKWIPLAPWRTLTTGNSRRSNVANVIAGNSGPGLYQCTEGPKNTGAEVVVELLAEDAQTHAVLDKKTYEAPIQKIFPKAC